MTKSTKQNYVLKVKTLDSGSGSVGETSISHAIPSDHFLDEYGSKEGQHIISPPYSPLALATMQEYSSELASCIDTMAINIDGHGHRIVPRDDALRGNDGELPPKVKSEVLFLKNFFSHVVLEGTLRQFRKELRDDLEATGNAYIEVIPSVTDVTQPVCFNHLPSWTMRLKTVDKEFTNYEVPRAVQKSDGMWEIQRFKTTKRFRRFVQKHFSTDKKVYFKEWGDPRFIDFETGQVIPEEELRSPNFDKQRLANPVIHMKRYCPRSPYGIPRWVGCIFILFGNKSAEKINYTTLRCNNIPSMFLMATNVALTDASLDRLKEFVEERIQSDNNYSTFVIVEAEPVTEGLKDPSNMKLELKSLKDTQQKDEMFSNYLDRGDEKVRRSFRLPPVLLGRADDYTRACYSDDTEVLTNCGWILHQDLDGTEEIAVYNKEHGEVFFEKAHEYHEYFYEGDMIHIKNRNFDILVTPDHRMLARRSNQKEYSVCKAWDIEDGRWNMISSTRLGVTTDFITSIRVDEIEKESHKDISSLPSRNINYDLFLQFLGYFVSDGGLRPDGLHDYLIMLRQKKEPVLSNIEKCLQNLGWKYDKISHSSDPDTKIFQLRDKGLSTWLRTNIGYYSHERRLPEWINKLSDRQWDILFNAMLDGDGSRDSREGSTSTTYYSNSWKLIGQVQAMQVLHGKRANVLNGTRCWRVCSSDHQEASVQDGYTSRQRYSGMVYCLKVSSGFYVTRRNGKVAIQGNTVDASIRVAEDQNFAPERQDFDDLMNNTVVPALNIANALYKSNSPNVTDNYELTQLLATAERSGGLSPHISRLIVEDVLGRDLPEVSEDIDRNLPFSLTMLRESLAARTAEEETTKVFSDEELLEQFRKLWALVSNNDRIPARARQSIRTILHDLEVSNDDPESPVTYSQLT